MKSRIVLYASLVLIACGAFIFLSKGFGDGGPAPKKTIQYLAVTRDLDPGSFIESGDLEWVEFDDTGNGADPRFFSSKGTKIEDLVGVVLRSPLQKGARLSPQDFIRPGESAFLAAVLKSGTRAVAIRVDDVTGGAGLIRPGNRVDVILSGKLDAGGAGKGVASAKTLLEDVRVIAVNRDVDPRASFEEESVRTGSKDNSKGTVMLEVLPKEAEMLTVARTVGVLSLSLRSLEGPSPTPRGGITKASDLVKTEGGIGDITTIYGTEHGRTLR